MSTAQVKKEGDRVLFIIDGRGYRIPAPQAHELSDMLKRAALAIDEETNAARIIADGALLTRVGVPIGLSNDFRIKNEIRKEAAWNSALRRALPGGVKSKAVFGVPSLKSIVRGAT